MYIHDSKTNLTLGPYRLDGSYSSELSFVYGPNVEETDPRFVILTQGGRHMAFDLRSVNSNSTLITFQVLNNAVVAENLKSYEFPIPCDAGCAALQSTELLGVAADVSLLVLIFVVLIVRHRFLKRRRLRDGTLAPSTAGTTHRPVDEYDMELPPYSPRAVDPTVEP